MDCQRLLMEGMRYHLLPQHRPSLQSPRTRPRKATVGAMFAVGGMDATKGRNYIFSPMTLLRYKAESASFLVYISKWQLITVTHHSLDLNWTKVLSS